MLPNFDYVRPGSAKDAIKHLSSAGARIHAGGTDLLNCLRDGVYGADKVVSLSKLPGLKGIKGSGRGLKIGAMTTITEVATNATIKAQYTALAQAAASVASPQLRNQGTIGGNICQRPWCWYFRGGYDCVRKGGDTCYAVGGENQYHCIFGSEDICYIVHPSDTAPALMALGASVGITGRRGERRVSMDKFFVGPGEDAQKETILEQDEIVTEIVLPAPPQGLKSCYRKVRERQAFDFALAGVALAIQMSGSKVSAASVVLSGAAPVPWRSEAAEKALIGQELDASTMATAAEAAVKGAEPMDNNAYKVPLFKGIIEEELAKLA
jgi:xanthine dehydrogenase YagS FAD-binding subunit